MKIIVAVVLVAAALPVGAALYKWTDSQGRVQYTDTPPPANAKKVEEPRLTHSTVGGGRSSFAVDDAAKRNPVTLWITDCGPICTQARELLAKRGVPHAVRNPSRSTEQEAWKKASGGSNEVPLLIIGSRTMKGFEESDWNTALDGAGYPRNAPAIKPQPVPVDPPAPAQPQQQGQAAAGAAAAAPAAGAAPAQAPSGQQPPRK